MHSQKIIFTKEEEEENKVRSTGHIPNKSPRPPRALGYNVLKTNEEGQFSLFLSLFKKGLIKKLGC